MRSSMTEAQEGISIMRDGGVTKRQEKGVSIEITLLGSSRSMKSK